VLPATVDLVLKVRKSQKSQLQALRNH